MANPRRESNVFLRGDSLAAAERIFGQGYAETVRRFKMGMVKYTEDPDSADVEELIRLSRETAHDFLVKDYHTSFYERILLGEKDTEHYYMLGTELFSWGFEEEAIIYLEKGISHRLDDQIFDLSRLRDDLEITRMYIGADKILKEKIYKAAHCDMDILIEGETGTGKEVIAALIHRLSKRKVNSFMPISCAELSPELMGSELFGHKKGAFTGAIDNRTGIFDHADKGVVFLDEVNELNPNSKPNFFGSSSNAKSGRLEATMQKR